ncbi:MAG: hypothetical protein K0S97_566 [Chloroflexota bacterium]|jgi:hypothetical protein|nr:hypothetical protein [Chloroflexota bacterium]
MNPTRERSAIVAAWLEEGPNELPESTRRAIAVDVRTTHQTRPSAWAPWRFPRMDRLTLVATAAVAVMALVVGGLVVRPFASDGSNVGGGRPSEPSPSTSSAPASASPSPPRPTTLVIPAMQQTFRSERFGYTVSYPAGWTVWSPAEPGGWSPPDWKDGSSIVDPFDYIESTPDGPRFRAGSAQLPVAMPDVDEWIDEFLTYGDPNCVPPRATQEVINIDGAPGRLWDACGEVEATVVVDGRVYMFTLFLGADRLTNGRQLFDALAATIDLRPEDAPLPSPSPSPESRTVGARLSREMPRDRAH